LSSTPLIAIPLPSIKEPPSALDVVTVESGVQQEEHDDSDLKARKSCCYSDF